MTKNARLLIIMVTNELGLFNLKYRSESW